MSYQTKGYNQSGSVISAGQILYGYEEDYIFEIPVNKKTSTAEFRRIDNKTNTSFTLTANAKITWTTPTGPAPTTPEILYNIANPYDYATVVGLTTAMEYCGEFRYEDSDKTYTSPWNSVTSEAMYFPVQDEEYTILVRYKTSANGNPSLNCRIPVKTREAAPSTDSIGYFDIQEILAIYPSERQIELALGDGMSYVYASPAYYQIGDFIDMIPSGSFDRIYIRYAATADTPASKYGTLTLYGRNPSTPDSVYYQNGALYNLTSDMVFSFDNGNTWYSTQYSAVNVTSFMGETETTVLIKYMPTETASCSETVKIILPALS